ncbi:MAG: hypothetical protein JJU29_22735 [Verrucomicrobia bacterium]|nr:hypothetical protein [Verrucomicrobiota bacterium]MCH8514539.1 hypothetical protein [Kiritimatiellia bacterium]
MTNPEKILRELDRHLHGAVDLILYGRGALSLAFPDYVDWSSTMDIDVIIIGNDIRKLAVYVPQQKNWAEIFASAIIPNVPEIREAFKNNQEWFRHEVLG